MNEISSRRSFCRSLIGCAGLAISRCPAFGEPKSNTSLSLDSLASPVLLAGDERNGFRDPAALFHDGWFYLYFTLMRKEDDDISYSYLAWSRSRDLIRWDAPETLTPRDKSLEYGSPGDIIRVGREWIICLQTYPRPHGERYGNRDCRLWTMRSSDLQTWSTPELLRVKGPEVARSAMGRMIDPFLLKDKDRKNLWWCFYKQNGISISRSADLSHWEYVGKTDAGENPCVIVDKDEYVLFHSPPNGIGIKRSPDLLTWRDEGVLTLGQENWDWAKGRITAGFVLDLRHEKRIRKAIMFFHASRFSEEDPRGGFDSYASIGIAWSSDLKHWEWPKKAQG
jgi:hypothetical protein